MNTLESMSEIIEMEVLITVRDSFLWKYILD